MDEAAETLAAVKRLKEAELSPQARDALDVIEAELSAAEPRTWMDTFRSRVSKAMTWVGIGAVGVATIGGLGYVGTQAVEAFPTAVETAAKREVKERVEAVQLAFADLQGAAGGLLLKLYDFMIALKDKATTAKGLSELASSMWDGIWAEGRDYFATGDKSPDKLIATMKEMVASDAELSGKMEAIFAAYENLKIKKDAFEAVGKGAFEANDTDALEFFEDYKREFWMEMKGKGRELSTSSPAPESPRH
jgi:hypothetical protein